jgi:hypothetical protein
MRHNYSRLSPYPDFDNNTNTVESPTPVLLKELAPAPPNDVNRSFRKEILNRHHVKLAIYETVRLHGKPALKQGTQVKNLHKFSFFSRLPIHQLPQAISTSPKKAVPSASPALPVKPVSSTPTNMIATLKEWVP